MEVVVGAVIGFFARVSVLLLRWKNAANGRGLSRPASRPSWV